MFFYKEKVYMSKNKGPLPGRYPLSASPRVFDSTLFENLCKVYCTVAEIEAIMQTDFRQLNKWCIQFYNRTFDEKYRELTSTAKASLRRTQFRLSQKNSQMAIWLGKVYLKQKEVQEVQYQNLDSEDQIIQPELRVTREEEDEEED